LVSLCDEMLDLWGISGCCFQNSGPLHLVEGIREFQFDEKCRKFGGNETSSGVDYCFHAAWGLESHLVGAEEIPRALHDEATRKFGG